MCKGLKIKAFHIQQCQLSSDWQMEPHHLGVPAKLVFDERLFHHVSVSLLPPGKLHQKTDTIMDILPIATKVIGRMGTGITHVLTGVTVVITGSIDEGEQFHEFGSSDGYLDEHLALDKPGTPSRTDWILLIQVKAKKQGLTRSLCQKVFQMVDDYLQPLRDQIKYLDGNQADESHYYEERQRLGKPKFAYVKQVAGQGAMYDTLLYPSEPAGYSGGESIIDMDNMPMYLTPNEYRDGALRAME